MQISLYILFISFLFIAPGLAQENPEVSRCKEAAQRFKKKEYDLAHAKATKSCPTLKDLARWKQLRYGQGDLSFEDYAKFVDTYKSWPWMVEVRKGAERFLTKETPAQLVVPFFERHPPKTFSALKHYVTSLQELKKPFKRVIQFAWVTLPLSSKEEKAFLTLWGDQLTAEDYVERFKRLLSQKNYHAAQRQLARCPSGMQSYLKVLLAVSRGDSQATELYEALVPPEQNRPDMIEAYLFYLLRKDLKSAYGFIKEKQEALDLDPNRFWRLRYIAARDALITKDYAKVFEVLKNHGLTKGHNYVRTQFLLGFVALRFSKDPVLALTYLEPAYGEVSAPGSLTRYAYWIAQAYRQKGDLLRFKGWLAKAKKHPQTFYGQEAFIAEGQEPELSFFRLYYSDQDHQKIIQSSYVSHIRLLKELGSYDDIAPFLYKIYYSLKGNGEKRALIDFCHKEFPEFVYDMARLSGVVYNYQETYPILPQTRALKDTAIVNAIIRKESGFNPYAISGAGARGLMQLMPKTAQIIGKELGHNVEVIDLTRNPELNIKLGDAYFSKKLERFKGHKELTLAGYNAGPLNSDKWIERYGDPRTDEIDLLTWIELIPYGETRSYVQRVIANERVYKKLLEQ